MSSVHTEDYNGYDTDYADITDLYLPMDCKPSHNVLLYKTQQYKIMYNIIPIHDNKSTVYYTQRGTHSLPMQGRYGVSYCTYETSLLPSFLSCCIQYWCHHSIFNVPDMINRDLTTTGSQIAKFMWPTWGPPGSWRPQVGPTLAPWILLSGLIYIIHCLFSAGAKYSTAKL